MAILQLKGGSAAQVAAYTPATREIVLDTTNWRLVFGDGSAVGGKPLSVASAPKWTTARKLTFTGAATGEATSVDGSADISITLTIGNLDMGTLS